MFLQFFQTGSTAPLVGGKLFTYIAGTSTKQATWKDSTQSVQNANPIILDSSGIAVVWLDPTLLYKFVLAPSNDTDPPASPIKSVDNIAGSISFAVLTQQFIGQILYPQTAAESAAGVTPTNYGYPPGDVRRYGAKGDGTTDDTTAITNALNSGVATIDFGTSAYTYRITSKITPTNSALSKLVGTASIVADISGLASNTFMLDCYANSIKVWIDGLTFAPKTTPQSGSNPWYGGTFSFNYKSFQAGVQLIQGSRVTNCKFSGFDYAGLYIQSTGSIVDGDTTWVQKNYFTGNANATFTGSTLNNIFFQDNNVYLGGEVICESCHNILIENNRIFLPGTPSIDIGGSAAVPTVGVKISGNIAYGLSAIVLEGGVSDATVIDNDCYCTGNLVGYGIGVSTNTGGQDIYRVKVTANRVYRYLDETGATNQMAVGIGIFASIAKSMQDIEISSNYVQAATVGIQLIGFNSSNLVTRGVVRDNTCIGISNTGISVNESTGVDIVRNNIRGNPGSYGIEVQDATTMWIDQNQTYSFPSGCYRFDGTMSGLTLTRPIHDASNESGLYAVGGLTSGNTLAKDVLSPFGVPTVGKWAQGSTFLTTVPASAGFIGSVCVTSGTPGTWKTFGLIS